MGPRDTPPEIVEAWENEIQEVLEDPDYRRIYSREMLSPAYMPQAEYARFIDSFATDTATFLRESGIID
jgi:tripartite-type tricarboxylate transporter receptor subunit TctC